MNNVLFYDPTASDSLSKVRGVGRYMQILRETFPNWNFSSHLSSTFPSTILRVNNHLPSIFINPFFNFLSPPLFIRRKFARQIAVIHDLIPLKYPEHFPIGLRGKVSILLNKIALSNYDVVITDSVQSKRDIVTILHISEKKVKVIYPCLSTIFTREKPISLHPTPLTSHPLPILPPHYLLYVGDATWNKNLVNLAKAIKLQELPCMFVGKVFDKVNRLKSLRVKEFKKQTSEVNDFLRLGEGREHPWQKELNTFMQLAKDDKHFIFPGFVSDVKLIDLYQNALCNILVSRDEGFGFSYLEASSQKCPTILSEIPVLREISQNTALFVNPENPKSIAIAIQTLQNNSFLRNNLIKQSYKRSTFFSQSSFKSQFLSVLS